MRSGGRERTAFLPFPKTCCETNLCPRSSGDGLRPCPDRGSVPVLQFLPPCSRRGAKPVALRQSRERDALGSRQAHGAMGNTAHDFQGRRRGQDNASEVPVPCRGGQGNCFRSQASCLNEEFGIWPRADEPDTEPVCGTPKQPLLQSLQSGLTAKVSLEKVKQEGKGKRWGEGCAFCNFGFDQRSCSECSPRRQKAGCSKPSPLTLKLNKQARRVTQPLS